jgi:hypothetical protein
MVDVGSKRCADEGCLSTSVIFDTMGKKKGLYCASHKKGGMVDVVSKRFKEEECFKSCPVFNFSGERHGL